MIPENKTIKSVGALIFVNKEKILAFKRVKSDGKFGQIAGKPEIGESPEEALKREIEEETGLIIDVPKEPIYFRYYEDQNYIHVVYCLELTLSVNEMEEIVKHNDPDGGGHPVFITPEDFIDPELSAYPEFNVKVLEAAGIIRLN